MQKPPDLRSLRSLDQGENANSGLNSSPIAVIGAEMRVHLEARRAAFEAVLSCSGELQRLAARALPAEPLSVGRQLGSFTRRRNPSDVMERRGRAAIVQLARYLEQDRARFDLELARQRLVERERRLDADQEADRELGREQERLERRRRFSQPAPR